MQWLVASVPFKTASGPVSAGTCVLLEAAGLVDAFDRVYGVSSGALKASATAMGQAAFSATLSQDAATRRIINPARPLMGRALIDFDFLFRGAHRCTQAAVVRRSRLGA